MVSISSHSVFSRRTACGIAHWRRRCWCLCLAGTASTPALRQFVQRFGITSTEILAARRAVRLHANHGTVPDDRSKVFWVFQPLTALIFDVHDVHLQALAVFRPK